MQALHTAATGMQAASIAIDNTADNLANQNTTGFKRTRVEFGDLLDVEKLRVGTQTSDAGTISPTGISIGLGVAVQAIYRINELGPLEKTDSPLDLAINGEGYFRIQRPDGTDAYTRAGSFQVNGESEIVTAEGFVVSPGVTIPTDITSLTINQSGEVIVTQTGSVAPTTAGQLDLARFVNPSGLKSIGSNLFIETEASGTPVDGVPGEDGFGTLRQGWLENSNVQPVTELTNLIKAQRAFEMGTKIIEAVDESLQTLNQST